MKKLISVNELDTQMFVCGFGKSPSAPRTRFAEFMVSSDTELLRLRKRFSFVWIDTERGNDVSTAKANMRHAPPRRPHGQRAEKQPTDPGGSSLREARALHQHTKSIVESIVDDLRFGHALDLRGAREAVSATIQHMLRDPSALLYLAQLKTADTSLAQRAVNTAILSLAFAKCITVANHQLRELGLAALLYDLGMITVPNHIRSKSGRLDPGEYDTVKHHVEASCALLRKVDGISETTLHIIETHHERVDGTGYPRGLRASEIGLLGRLLSIVSVYITLTSTRPYADAVSMKDALATLYDDRDKAYDGRLVQKFIRCIGVYPPGSVVVLRSGEAGLVIASGKNRLRPLVKVFSDKHGQPLTSTYLIDLSSPNDIREIARVLKPHEYDIHSHADGSPDQLVLHAHHASQN